ncbi:hypothetical protein [Streptomyces sp. NRRL S-87]|uniref:hypothetical protein n=1 Tax=Streptomyces sp. NRRL S-87 TaxID=1463920 RepID=UPI0004BE7DC5|nr:hypothetical protein [Streptomyces sp. NRRL S-87]
MGLAVYTEDQNHQRAFAGKQAGRCLEEILPHVEVDSLLYGVHRHGDTMFNSPQLMRVTRELDLLLETHPQMRGDAAEFKAVVEGVVRRRGYLWVSGD